MENVIVVQNLVKKYGDLTAVNDISFEVRRGEVFGLLGENGAGKTTTLEIIEGLRKATSGKITVFGADVSAGISRDVKEKIGVQLQSSAYYNFLTLREILELFGSFYKKSISPAELLKMVDLQQKAKSLVKDLSGGQKQRFSIIASLVNDPEIVFLDEPTTGLDPVARRKLWDIIVKIKNQGKTIILTTHYMDEAEVLSDRIAIMEKGKILKMNETHKLIGETKHPFKISFILPKINDALITKLQKFGQIANLAGKSEHYEMHLKTQNSVNQAIKLVNQSDPESFTVGRASLEDLFIELTGKKLEN